MKIVNYKSGLGNQVFYYLLGLYLQDRFPDDPIYGFYNPKWLTKHSGLELDYAFDVKLPPETAWSKVAANWARIGSHFFKNLRVTDETFNENALFFDGWWQDKKFFLENLHKIKFRERTLSSKNAELIDQITSSQSVSIHIRRGDYLAPEHINEFGGICTEKYYDESIRIVLSQCDNPIFFVFSNDIEWVKKNMKIPSPIYVDNNTGIDSYMDMYLMSRCKTNIIANSSFSYWGAMLNINKPHLVLYPRKWSNSKTPNIFPQNWIGL